MENIHNFAESHLCENVKMNFALSSGKIFSLVYILQRSLHAWFRIDFFIGVVIRLTGREISFLKKKTFLITKLIRLIYGSCIRDVAFIKFLERSNKIYNCVSKQQCPTCLHVFNLNLLWNLINNEENPRLEDLHFLCRIYFIF